MYSTDDVCKTHYRYWKAIIVELWYGTRVTFRKGIDNFRVRSRVPIGTVYEKRERT